jgi:peptidoglycan LD-endopeptidase LytH
MKRLLKLLSIVIFAVVLAGGLFIFWYVRGSGSDSNSYIREWLLAPIMRPFLSTDGGVACKDAPFILPSEGFIGLLWADPARPYNVLRRHPGVDIFGDGEPGIVPNYAAYDGYLTRLSGWKSAVTIRHDDPLQPGRIIWTYYTHMANEAGTQSYIVDDFPPGTSDKWIEQGTLLGYQGVYSGTGPPIAMHLHFSIVRSDNNGMFLNEAVFENTLDPSPYLGLPLNIGDVPERPIRCP